MNNNLNNNYSFDPVTGQPINQQQQSKKNNKVLIIVIILLIIGIVAGIFFFTNQDKKESTNNEVNNNPEVGTNFSETEEKQSPKYSSRYVSKTALYEILSNFSYEEEIYSNFKSVFDKVDGRILDAYSYDREIYFLTASNIYKVFDLLLWSEPLNLDTIDNNKIEIITDDFIVLSNDKREFTVYNKGNVYKNKDFSIVTNEYILGNEDTVLWDYLHIVKSVTKEGILMQDFVILNPYEENEMFGFEEEELYKYDRILNSEVKEYIVNKKKSSLNGVLLLNNNDLYYLYSNVGIYSSEIFKIKSGPINNINKVWNTTSEKEFFVSKVNELNCIYKYNFNKNSDTGEITREEVKIVLPDDFMVDDIVEIFDNMPLDENYYIKFKNGDIYTYNDGIEKHTVLTELLKQGNMIEIFNIEGITCVVMDDGNIYSIISDNEIERYNLN